MRLVSWFLGVMLILVGIETKGSDAGHWLAVWVTTAILWFLVGCGLGISGLARLVKARLGAGAAMSGKGNRDTAPASHKEG